MPAGVAVAESRDRPIKQLDSYRIWMQLLTYLTSWRQWGYGEISFRVGRAGRGCYGVELQRKTDTPTPEHRGAALITQLPGFNIRGTPLCFLGLSTQVSTVLNCLWSVLSARERDAVPVLCLNLNGSKCWVGSPRQFTYTAGRSRGGSKNPADCLL